MPRPARSTGTTTTSGPIRRPGAGPSGVSTVDVVVGTSRSASAASSTLMRVAARRKCSGVVRLSRSEDERVVHERVVDEVDRHGVTIHDTGLWLTAHGSRAKMSEVLRATALNRAEMLAVRAWLIARLVAVAGDAAGRGGQVALVVVGRTVITENAAHQVLSPGAVAINGTDIVEVGTPEAIAAKYQAAETIDARDQIVLPGPHQHAHARADGDVPRPGRRPRADGLAAEIHLSGRSEDRVARSSCAPARAWPRSR